MITTRQDLARAIEDIGCRQEEPGGQIAAIIETFNQLLLPEPVTPKRRIGSNPDENATACTTDGYEPVINEYVSKHSFGHLKRRFATNGCV
jgi:hypothetical protein